MTESSHLSDCVQNRNPSPPEHISTRLSKTIRMDCYDDDFSTIRARPRPPAGKQNTLSSWKSDIGLGDGDRTLTRHSTPPQPHHSPENGFDDSDDEFAVAFEKAAKVRNMASQQNQMASDAFLSDSSSKSPGRASISSAASATSTATSMDAQDEFYDSDFEFDEPDLNLKANLKSRLAARQEKAAREAAEENAKLTAKYMRSLKKKESRRPFVEFEDELGNSDFENMADLGDSGLEALVLRVKNGTVNKNIKFATPLQTTQNINNPQSRMLRGMRSIAQMPNQRSDPLPNLRGAVSMLDLGKKNDFGKKSELGRQADFKNRSQRSLWQLPMQSQPSPQQQITTRPLTSYKDPTTSAKALRNKRPHKPNLIRNPAQYLSKQERNGMVLNPSTGMWEGNEAENSRFEFDTVKPKLITKQALIPETPSQKTNGMLFDNRTLSWVYANEQDYEDPFAEIEEEDLQPLDISTNRHFRDRNFTSESQMSTASTLSHTSSVSQLGRASVTRSESSADQVFELRKSQISEWKHADERFMRKFGKWIGGKEEKADALLSDQHFYDMVRNA